ncbi:MAG: CAP domain-containing protein [Deltaproteobacteria bacterium]|nr:CAP domain-containing protein [Deltaproteobacteria bacterium]
MEEAILSHTNRERLLRGLTPLAKSSALNFVAREHAKNMCAADCFQHESEEFPAGWRRFGERLQAAGVSSGGENIAYRTIEGTPDAWGKAVVSGWMESPRHKKNVLNPGYRYLGIGVDGCNNRIGYATQIFSSEPGRDSAPPSRSVKDQ